MFRRYVSQGGWRTGGECFEIEGDIATGEKLCNKLTFTRNRDNGHEGGLGSRCVPTPWQWRREDVSATGPRVDEIQSREKLAKL